VQRLLFGLRDFLNPITPVREFSLAMLPVLHWEGYLLCLRCEHDLSPASRLKEEALRKPYFRKRTEGKHLECTSANPAAILSWFGTGFRRLAFAMDVTKRRMKSAAFRYKTPERRNVAGDH
jgi:hypothetical protein